MHPQDRSCPSALRAADPIAVHQTRRPPLRSPGRRIRDGSTEQMLALRARGWTQAAIAARFGLSRGSVQDRLRTATRTLASQRSPIVTAESRNEFQFWSTHAVHCLRRYGLMQGAKVKRVPGWVLRATPRAAPGVPGGPGRHRWVHRSPWHDEDPAGESPACGGREGAAGWLWYPDFQPLPPGLRCCRAAQPRQQGSVRTWAIVCSSAGEVATIPFADSLYRTRVQANAGRRRRGGKDAAKAGLDDCLGFYTVWSIVPEAVEPVRPGARWRPRVHRGRARRPKRSSVGGSATGEALQVSHCFAGKDRPLAPHRIGWESRTLARRLRWCLVAAVLAV